MCIRDSTTTTTWRGYGKSDGANPNANGWQDQPAWDVNNSTSYFVVAADCNPTSSAVIGRYILPSKIFSVFNFILR